MSQTDNEQALLKIDEMYRMAVSADLALMQSDEITFAEWNRRQKEHCNRYFSDRAAIA